MVTPTFGGHWMGDSNSGPPPREVPGGGCAGGLTCGSLAPVVTARARCAPLPAGSACTHRVPAGSGPVWSRTPLALRSSATRDRSAGRVRQGDASLDKLITCSQSQIGRCCHLRGWRTAQLAAALWLSVVVRSGTVQDCCECHAVARPSKMTLGTRSHRWFHPDRRVRPSSVTIMLRATGSCRVAVVPDVCWTGETLADQADSQRFLPPSATEPGRPVCRLGWRFVRSHGLPPNGSRTWRNRPWSRPAFPPGRVDGWPADPLATSADSREPWRRRERQAS